MTRLIPIADHPNNLDAEARLVAEDRVYRWSIYAVKGGFVALFAHQAIEGLFPTEKAAREAIDLMDQLCPQGPGSLDETFSQPPFTDAA